MNESILLQLTHLAVFVTAVGASLFMTPLMEKISVRSGYLDYPGGRKQHARPTPLLGGVAVFVSFWGVVWVGLWVSRIVRSFGDVSWIPDTGSIMPQVAGIFLGSLILCIVGLLDDRYHWSPLRKLVGQVLARVSCWGWG
ncbi:MAG: hypothetical protein IPK72_22435 [Candidatus Eisenbacteria bacterium]|nr:hypothetical protein [Candidatus Eisenbacteria bacterium]